MWTHIMLIIFVQPKKLNYNTSICINFKLHCVEAFRTCSVTLKCIKITFFFFSFATDMITARYHGLFEGACWLSTSDFSLKSFLSFDLLHV